MALREFVDRAGVSWRVWSVAIDQVYSKTARLDFLGPLQDGWLCFESAHERRRLVKYPEHWHRMTGDELISLLSQASPVPRRGSSGKTVMEPGDI